MLNLGGERNIIKIIKYQNSIIPVNSVQYPVVEYLECAISTPSYETDMELKQAGVREGGKRTSSPFMAVCFGE